MRDHSLVFCLQIWFDPRIWCTADNISQCKCVNRTLFIMLWTLQCSSRCTLALQTTHFIVFVLYVFKKITKDTQLYGSADSNSISGRKICILKFYINKTHTNINNLFIILLNKKCRNYDCVHITWMYSRATTVVFSWLSRFEVEARIYLKCRLVFENEDSDISINEEHEKSKIKGTQTRRNLTLIAGIQFISCTRNLV